MNYIILKDSSILLTMLASMISPVFILPTPSGVPVNMRSPCFNGTSAAISHSNSCGGQIMSAQEPDCLNSPFTFNLSSKSDSSSNPLIGRILEIGALPTKLFPRNQGFPSFLAFSDPVDLFL